MSNEDPNKERLKNARIAISGKSGCGNTTVSRLVADMLGLRLINFTFRSLAEEKGLTLKDVLALAAEDDWWDREVDDRQVRLARENGGCVLGSRLAIWMMPEADLKVVLSACPDTRARRIQHREGDDLAAIAEFTKARDDQDKDRYMKIYQIDNDDYSFADLIIDTDRVGAQEIAEEIVAAVKKKVLAAD